MEHIKIDNTQQRGTWGRIILMATCALAAAGALWQINASWLTWLAVLVPALLWPVLAQWLTQRSAHSDSNDVILAFVDGIVIGVALFSAVLASPHIDFMKLTQNFW